MIAELVLDELLQSAIIDIVTRFDQRDSLLIIHYVQSLSNQPSISAKMLAIDLELTEIDTLILQIATRQCCDLAYPLAFCIINIIGSLSLPLDSVLILIINLL